MILVSRKIRNDPRKKSWKQTQGRGTEEKLLSTGIIVLGLQSVCGTKEKWTILMEVVEEGLIRQSSKAFSGFLSDIHGVGFRGWRRTRPVGAERAERRLKEINGGERPLCVTETCN